MRSRHRDAATETDVSVSPPIVTFLSDYGTTDEFVGVCVGMMWRIEPDIRVLDVTHEIAPGNIRSGALCLARSISYVPVATHLAIVDPGVGTHRRAIAIETADSRHFVAPDNGLVSAAVALCGGAVAAVELDPQRWGIDAPSKTFAGRDVFAPAAGALAAGAAIDEVGSPVDVATLNPMLLPLCETKDGRIHGIVFWIDRFGNVGTNIAEADLVSAGIAVGDRIWLRHGDERHRLPFVETFADVKVGEPLCLIDSVGQLTIAVRGGHASSVLEIAEDAQILVEATPGTTIPLIGRLTSDSSG